MSVAKVTEHGEQSCVIDWCKRMAGMYPELDLIFSVPNGAVISSYALVQKLKSEGLRPGVPDLCLPVAHHGLNGLFIEMKLPGGVASAEQKRFMNAVIEQGYEAVVCRSAEEAIDRLKEYLGLE